jgi:hypothetical protein
LNIWNFPLFGVANIGLKRKTRKIFLRKLTFTVKQQAIFILLPMNKA